MKLLICILATLFLNGTTDDDSGWSLVGNPLLLDRPCNGSTDITINYEPGRSPDKENSYSVYVHKKLPRYSVVLLKFDAETSVILSDKSVARIDVDRSAENGFKINFFEAVDFFSFTVQGRTRGVVPYFKSFIINNKEYCGNPRVGFLDRYIKGYKDRADTISKEPEGNCGRPKILHTELIVNGASTKAGDWPWHIALYRINHSEIKYICGGTLISNYYVLTAAHCASIRGVAIVPEALSVILGKFNLIGGDVGTQEREVHKVILHELYSFKELEHDIALLKLKSEVKFTDYVQPACLWYSSAYDKLPTKEIVGTVVGWGFDNTDQLSPQLKKAQLPIVSDSACIKSKPLFYSKILDEHRFCAGYIESGVSACNGDSGSAFQVFLPDKVSDKPKDNATVTGAWYVRGIVSLTVSRTDTPICDPNYYGVYTDVAKYTQWIDNHIHE